MSFFQGSDRAAGGQEGEKPGDIYAELRNSWLIHRAAARSRIIVYFPGLYACWYSYERAVSDFLSLGAGGPSAELADKLKSYLDADFAKPYIGFGTADVSVTATTATVATTPGSAPTGGGDDGCESLSALPDFVQRRFDQLRDDSIKWGVLDATVNDKTTTAKGTRTAATTGAQSATTAAVAQTGKAEKAPKGFGGSYQALAEAMLIGMERIVYSIEKTPAKGFSHGLGNPLDWL